MAKSTVVYRTTTWLPNTRPVVVCIIDVYTLSREVIDTRKMAIAAVTHWSSGFANGWIEIVEDKLNLVFCLLFSAKLFLCWRGWQFQLVSKSRLQGAT